MIDEKTRLKQQAANAAVELVESGMVLGLGEGSTAAWAVRRIGELHAAGAIENIVGIAASLRMENLAQELGIPLATLADHPVIDLTIDGADEVDPDLNLIKGGGGALLREKILAQATRREVIVVDESKLVERLGTTWAVPVEVFPFGWESQAEFLRGLGAKVTLRHHDDSPYVTDQGNHVLDCDFGPIADAVDLGKRLKMRTGIAEHGLFLGFTSDVLIAAPDGIRHLRRET